MLSSLSFAFQTSPQDFKTRLLGRGFHTLIKNDSFSLQPMWDHTIHPPRGPASLLAHHLVSTPFGTQPPLWHIARCLALIPLEQSKPTANKYSSLRVFPSGFSFKFFRTYLIERGFHTLTKNIPFSSPTDVRSQRELQEYYCTH